MRTYPITLSHSAVTQLVHTLQLSGRWLLPCEVPPSAQDFLRARSEWEQAGLAELDFDGSLHPQPVFARMLYNLTHAGGAMRLCDADERTLLYIRGPVDLLRLQQTGGAWTLALRPSSEVYHWAKEYLLTATCGHLSTEGIRDGAPCTLQAELSQELVSGDSRIPLLNEHLLLFYRETRKEEANAGFCHRDGSV